MTKSLKHVADVIGKTKLYKHIERLNTYLVDPDNVYPIYVEVSPTTLCNHNCVFCGLDFIRAESRNMILDDKVLDTLCRDLHTCGVRSLMFAGEGEPLLHPTLPSIVREWSPIIDTALTTNGIFLTPDKLDLLQACKWIKLSIDAGDVETYTALHKCPASDWRTLWANVRSAIEYRKKNKTADFVLGAQALILEDNLHTLPKLAQLCAEAELDYLVLKPYSKHSKSINDLTGKQSVLSPGGLAGLEDLCKSKTGSRIPVVIRRDVIEPGDLVYDRCLAVPYFWAYVDTRGDVYGCSDKLGDAEFCYGNIESMSFSAIWQGDRRKKCMHLMSDYSVTRNCRPYCRMDGCNRLLYSILDIGTHDNFI